MPLIVVAEDDATLRSLLVEALGDREGWTVAGVADGEGLLQAAVAQRPELIVMDVRLRDQDGIEVYHRLRGLDGLGQVPVLFATADVARVPQDGLDGPHATLAKPFDLDELLDRVETLLGEEGRG